MCASLDAIVLGPAHHLAQGVLQPTELSFAQPIAVGDRAKVTSTPTRFGTHYRGLVGRQLSGLQKRDDILRSADERLDAGDVDNLDPRHVALNGIDVDQ